MLFFLHEQLWKNLTRVYISPGKLGKSWNYILTFSRAEKSWKSA